MKKLNFFDIAVLLNHVRGIIDPWMGTANLLWGGLAEMDRMDLWKEFTGFQGYSKGGPDMVKPGGYAVICEEEWCDTLWEELETIYNQHKR